ncbi:acetate kinase [Luteimonas sp. RIT-PG2_3]
MRRTLQHGRRRRPLANGLAIAMTIALALTLADAAQAQSTVSGDTATPVDGEAQRLHQLESRLAAQDRHIDDLKALVARQQQHLEALEYRVRNQQLEELRARGASSTALQQNLPMSVGAAMTAIAPAAISSRPVPSQSRLAGDQWPATRQQVALADIAPADATPADDGQATRTMPVGQPPEEATRPPEVAQIFDQPGVLTAKGRFVLEPSMQFGYSSNDRVALVGYTVIPAILIGLIDVRQVKTTSLTAALTARYGVSRRFELEVKAPFSYMDSDTVSREIFTGSAQDKVFNADGHGLGDVEVAARYQLNHDGFDKPFYVLWMRYKSRTGKDLFNVVTDCVTRCVANATGTGLPLELPTGSGFAALQPGITWLYASDPVVFFGSLSYLHNFARKDVSRTVLSGAPEGYPQTTTELIGEIDAGDIIGFNFGMGLALNERAALSFGYDHNLVDRTKQNGEDAPGAVRVMLGTLVLGGSYRVSDRTSLNVALGVGVTRDTPDVSLAVRMPILF